MLTPEDLEKAGELVGSVYTDVEAEMLDYLTAKMIDGDVAGQRSQTAILLLAQSSTADLRGILDDHGRAIDEAVRKEVGDALRRSDADDLAKIKRGLGVDLPGITNRQTAATVAGVEEILGRHNLQMEQAAKDAFIRCSSEAITMVNTGAMTTEQALHRAVRKLEREGVTIIQYQNAETGAKTVANKLDVAVRRHVRTQIAQDGARMTELRMDEAGIEFVEVSSHAGARPSHQEWEGKVYSRNGRKTVDGVTYEDFRTACHWGDVGDGIYGANCRHSHGPWIPGTPRSYEKDPKHPSGLDNDEIYKLNQRQREMERDIRATKRELRGCEIEYGKTGSLEAQADAAKLKKKLQGQQAKLREHIDGANKRCKPGTSVLQRSPRREWAGDMPKSKVPAIAGRKIDDVLGMPSVAKKIEGAGTSKARLRAQLISELKDDGLAPQSFQFLTTKQQASFIQRALNKLPANKKATAKAAAGKHAKRIGIDRTAKVYSKVETKHVDKIDDIVENAKGPAKEVYQSREHDITLLDGRYTKRGAHFTPTDVGVNMNVAQTYADRKRPSMYTWFHEFGHNIDYIATGPEDYLAKWRATHDVNAMYASTKYKGGLFGKTLRQEAQDTINARQAAIKADLLDKVDRLDMAALDDLHANYKLGDDAYTKARHAKRHLDRLNSAASPEEFEAVWGMTAKEVRAEVKEAKKAIKADPRFKRQYDITHARKSIEDEIRALSDAEKCDVSDIFEGATKGKVQAGWGHGKSYWNDATNLPCEAFAEFFSASIANPESMRVLEQYFPKSRAVFDDILAAIQGGQI